MINLKNNKLFKFFGAGIINTVLSYMCYLLLLLITNYQISYAISFIFGIAFSYWLNIKYVFESHHSIKKSVLFPLIYLVQYILGALLLSVIVENIDIDKRFAPIVVTIILLPITYIMTKKLLHNKN
ncbi:GtrA family protein [Sulfurospirillum diekertiae]|uniref:GtrA family protein n=1 Tax=Sulfurospirillum diekertiae TaxID=1854492 RepID=A0A6G9VQK9_9BACT|nr:GtrA family protein [Sulfurospirillum diekertiae]QIR78091.1 GtrA family protein [Sulfurospirillum diekertiae]